MVRFRALLQETLNLKGKSLFISPPEKTFSLDLHSLYSAADAISITSQNLLKIKLTKEYPAFGKDRINRYNYNPSKGPH
jgi:hypothetical protein